ncbi:hypothetical protein Tco_1175482 [Tanacetum coccineum]
MGTKVTSSSGSVLEEPEIQKLQMQAKIFKENSLNKWNALKSTTQLLERQTFSVLNPNPRSNWWEFGLPTWHTHVGGGVKDCEGFGGLWEVNEEENDSSQTLMVDDMLKAQSKVIDILCNLELIYPPAFFNIMIHLVIHLPLEAIFGGPIRPRWMYPFERYMKKLKNYVRNKAKPEGSIAEGYVAEEALTFSSYYFRDVTMKFNCPDRNVDFPPPTCQFQVFKSLCKSIGLRSVIRIYRQELKKVIWYVLHNSPEIDSKRNKNRIMSINNALGDCIKGSKIAEEFVNHFDIFLGQVKHVTHLDSLGNIFTNTLSTDEANAMVVEVYDNEIKSVIFGIGDCKAPRPDGYTTCFLKKAWSIVGSDVCLAIKGKLLTEVKYTLIALIPKIYHPKLVTNFNPIACCNVLYKCISKILTNRLRDFLDKLVNLNQSAFIEGMNIQDNILLTQEFSRVIIGKGVPEDVLLKLILLKPMIM